MLSTTPAAAGAVLAGGTAQETPGRNAAADADEWEGGEGEGDEEEDELASELWEGDSAVAAEDWVPPPPGDEEEFGEDDDDLDVASGEEEEEEDDDEDDEEAEEAEEAGPLSAREAGSSTPSDMSSGSHRSAADTEDAVTEAAHSPGEEPACDNGAHAATGREGLAGRKKFKRVGSSGSGRAKKDKDPRWISDLDEKGEMKTTTIDFSLSVDLRKTPELLCKSKDRVPLFKLTASGSYNCTRNAFRRAGFKQTKGNNFTVLWGMALKMPEFKELKEFQRVNHFPGAYLLGRKDNMARVCNKFRRTFGAENFEYFPKTFICPGDRAELLADEEECKAKAKKGEVPMWIVKPPAGCKGIGIRLVTDPSTQIKERAIVVVSRYIDKPCLINQTKFDLRLYVAVTSFNPLRVYLHEHGLARFCTVKYTNKSRKNRFRHLTNYSLNKNNPEFKRAQGDADDEGHKWSIRAVWEHLEKEGVDTGAIKEKIDDLIVKTLLAVETQISTNMQLAVPHRNNCFEIFGFDVILDDDYKPWLVEVNTALSLATDAPLDKKIKNQVVTELLHMLRIQCYDRKKLEERLERDKNSRLHGTRSTGKKATSNTENARRRDVCAGKKLALEELTEEDVKILEEIDDEHARCGAYRRIYPQNNEQMHKWMQLFEVKRYNNILQYQWITRSNTTPARELMEQQQRALASGAGGQTPVKRGGLRAAAAKAKALMTQQRGDRRAPMSPGTRGAGGGGRDVNDMAECVPQGRLQQQNGVGHDWMEQGQGNSGRPYNRGGLSSSSSRSVSSPPSPGAWSGPPRGVGRDTLQQHPQHQAHLAAVMYGGAARSAPQVTRAQAERRHGSVPHAAHPMSTYQLSSAKGEEMLAKMGRAQAWTDFGRADGLNERLPPLGSPQRERQSPSLHGQVEWIISRERGSARPQSPAGSWARAQPSTRQRGNGASPTSAIGLQGNSLRLGSSRGESDRGVGASARGGNSRFESTSIGNGMLWPDYVLSAVVQASQYGKSSVPMRTRQPAGYAPLHVASHAPPHWQATANSSRTHPLAQGQGSMLGQEGGGDLGVIIPEPAAGSTSAPVASPRDAKSNAAGVPAGRTGIGYSGKDALLPQPRVSDC